MQTLTIFSPAKLNLGLRVLGRRRDGYHTIKTVMVPITFGDRIVLRMRREGFSVSSSERRLPLDESNLALRAARLFFNETGARGGVSIRIEKRIPLASGLGGASSNAASVLLGLRRLTKKRVSEAALCRWGRLLGADVPFFIRGRPARVGGIGEQVRILRSPPNYSYILINPGFGVSTAWAYGRVELLKLTRKRPANRMRAVQKQHNLLNLLRFNFLQNDLERVVRERHPLIDNLKRLLLEAGALGAAMSGSGPTVFGVYGSTVSAKEGLARLKSRKKRWPERWTAILVRGL